MAKQLSQEEIDILLDVRSQMGMAEDYGLDVLETMMTADQEKRVTPYNFKRPRLFSQDQMRVVGHVHEAFAREFSVYLSAQLRTIVDINLTAVDQVLYSEFVMSSAPPSALYVMEAEELEQKIVFELDPRLVVYTIEKLFGGPGVFLQRARETSRIEQRVMSKVMSRAFIGLEKAWGQAFEIHFNEVAFESNAEFVQIIPGVEPAIVCTFEVAIYEQRSFINICYPYLMLERILGRTGMKQWISSATKQVEPDVRERYQDNLRSMGVELRAQLGHTRLSVHELMQLEMGDVIPLERRTNEAIQVLIGNKEKFRAVAGRTGKRRALRILEAVDSPMIEDNNEL